MLSKKVLMSLALVILLIVGTTLAGCGPGEERIVLATGGTGGVYYPLGGAMADIWSEHIDEISASSESTGASVENVNLVHYGESHLGLIQNDITYYAFHQDEMFSPEGDEAVDEPLNKLRWVAGLYPEVIQVIADADAGIQTVSDLEGMRIAVGAPGSGHEANARQILQAHGFDYDDFATVDFIMHTEAVDAVRDGHLDAYFTTAGIPTASAVDIFTTHDVNLVAIEMDMVSEIIDTWPFYAEFTVPAGTYSGQDEPVETVAVMATLVVNEDVDEDLVYNMTKVMFENLDRLRATHERANDITLDTALEGQSVDLHPGAQRYYEEEGIL